MKKILILCLLLVFWSIRSYAQEGVIITGIVTDTAKHPLPGVSIKEGSKNGTVTDDEGRFSIKVKNKNSEISVSSIGYIDLKLKLNGQKDLKIYMTPKNGDLSDVVVIGMQRQSARTTVAAVSGVTSKDIENRPVASVDILLQGQIAGLNVQVSSGEPGVAPTIVVRGNSTVNTNIGSDPNVQQAQALSGPLYVIDGIPIDPADIANNAGATGTNFLAGLNINDIESVQVQKDAVAAAAWGSRGANGVIYITTKKGTSKVPIFGINAYSGFNQRPELLPTLTGAAERTAKVNILNQYASVASGAQLASLPQLLGDSLNPSFNNATDWQGLFYQNGAVNNVDATMSAASENVNYRLSLGYYNTEGIIRNTGYQRYSLRGNFGFTITPKLKSQLIIGMVKENRQAGQKYANTDDNTPFSGVTQPTSFYHINGFDSSSFLGIASKLRNINLNDNYSASVTTTYDITRDLQYTLQGSANIYVQSKDYFQPSSLDAVAALTDPGSAQASFAESDRGSYSTYLVTNTLAYNKLFETKKGNSHSLLVTASQQYTSNVSSGNSVSGYNTPSNDIQLVVGIPQSDISGRSYYQKDALLSMIGQVQYSFNGRYLLYGSYRGDASSRFGDNNKWGYFPAVGAGWIVSDESFMNGLKDVVSFLKIRASYGSSGKNSKDFYAPFNAYNISGTYNGGAAIQPSYTNGLTKNDLTWAKSLQKDIGFDLQLFKNRVTINTDFYDKLDKNDFYNFKLPFFTGYTDINFNANDLWVDNRGVDLTINTHNLSPTSKFQWNSQLIFTYQTNKIAKLPNNNRTLVIDDYSSGVSRIFSVGQPIYEMYQMHYEGVYNHQSEIPFNPLTGKVLTYFKDNFPVMPGYPKWKDANGDGDVWSGEDNGDQFGDRIPTGDPNPKFVGGFTNDFSYKNFTLTISSVYSLKRTVVNTFFQQQLDAISSLNNFAKNRLPDLSGLDYWTPAKAEDPNYKAGFPAISPFGGYFYQYFPFTDMFNVDGSYFKIKNIILNYVVPHRVTDRLKIKQINFYAMMYNVLIIKNKKNTMPDPEAVDQLGVYSGGLYPQAKTYTIGFNLQF